MPTKTTTFATNDVLTADHLNSLAGAWNSYTPTVGGFTAGNGTRTGRYLQFGKLVIMYASFTFGSTSAAASATPTLSLPVTAYGSGLFVGQFNDAGTSSYAATAVYGSSTTVGLRIVGSSGIATVPSTTTPFTWVTGDSLSVYGLYEAE